MKRICLTMMMCGCLMGISAQTIRTDSMKVDMMETVEGLYRNILPLLDNIEFVGNSPVSRDISDRWNRVINHLKNNSGSMAEDVKDLLVSPSGKPIDLELLQRFITVNGTDSGRNVKFNMDFLLDEMKAAGKKVSEAAKKMAETK